MTPKEFTRLFLAPAVSGKTYLLYGEEPSPIFKLSMILCAMIASQEHRYVAIVDGCNRINLHSLIRFAQQREIYPVDDVLARLYVSRCFTCYQMEATLTANLINFVRESGIRSVFVFGLLDTMYDEQAPYREVKGMLPRIFTTVKKMQEGGISILFTSQVWNVLPKERNGLFGDLKKSVDRIFHFVKYENQRPKLFLEEQIHKPQQRLKKKEFIYG